MEPILKIENLAKHFGDTKVLRDINLDVYKGDVIAIIGQSGSGKSTFLRCINCLEEATKGKIYFHGNLIANYYKYYENRIQREKIKYKELKKDLTFTYKKKLNDNPCDKEMLVANYHKSLSDAKTKYENIIKQHELTIKRIKEENNKEIHTNFNEYRRKVTMVFQQFNLFNNYDVLNNCILAQKEVLHISKADAEKKAIEELTKVGMIDRMHYRISKISGGQKQRVAIARALSMDPEVILFDEPTSALDPEMVNDVLNVIKSLAQEGMTLIIVTHEMNFAKNVANKVLFMDEGYVRCYGTPSEIFDHPTDERLIRFLQK